MPQARLRLIIIFVLVLLLAAWWLFFRPPGVSGPGPTPTFPAAPQVTFTPPSLDDLARQFPRLEKLLRDPSVDSAYKDFVVAYERGGLEAAEQLARTRGLLTPENHVRVTLVLGTADTARLIEDLQALGVNVLGTYQDLVDISIPLDVIVKAAQSDNPAAVFERIRDLENVIGLQLTAPSTPQDAHHTPLRQAALVSEGVPVIGADAWHAAGFTGQGIKIGILDQGFDGYRDLLGSELPDRVATRSFVAEVTVDETGENHGTAVAEIVHDVAPSAELYLAHYDGGDVSMGNAVDWLLAQGVQIISHSAGGLAGPMDGTGRDVELVDRVAAQGVLWINSAGNSANEHYRAVFVDADGDQLHDFAPGTRLLAFRPVPDQLTQIVLNWDDWPLADQDYDLYLFDRDGVVLASSRNVQVGERAPVEQILYRFEDQGTYYVGVQQVNASAASRLDLYIHEANSLQFVSPSHSLATPADARGALTIGAAYYRDGSLQPFSSYGPTNDGRQKPELLGPDGITVMTYAPNAFFGTSAAAPHVAGAAALVWSAYSDYAAANVRDVLIQNTIRIGGLELVDATGAGLLRLPTPPPAATDNVRPTATTSQAAGPTTSAGGSAGAVAAICLVGIGAAAIVIGWAVRQRGTERRPAIGGRAGAWRAEAGRPAAITCTACGALARSGAQFCGQCGRPIEAAASRACAQCRRRLRPGAAYCSSCGAAV
ncbi:MAG TPA: S8 family serine peptidase [Anaerolineae bacterium]|nr:S8 family serine peptidase [Anaerolineae bacterium]